MARKVLFPLEASILFDKRDEAWLQPLAWDSAYLHAMVFTTQDYFGSLSPVASSQSKQQALSHCLTTLRLLRERMLNNPQMMLADSTVAAVLALAAHAHFVGDHQSARHHLDGLHRIVHLKGGPSAFKNNPKLLVEILRYAEIAEISHRNKMLPMLTASRCDIGVALNINCPTLFFEQPDTLEAFMRCPQYQLPDSLAPLGATASAGERLDLDDLAGQMDDELGRLWSLMHEFCAMVNFATCSGYRISFDEFLSVMVSVSYRLLHMHFEDKRANEAIRLGLLAFSSGIFLQWRQLGLIYSSLSSSYRRCLLELKATDVSPEFALWLLMVGAVSVMDDTDIDWMRPLFVEKLEACHIRSWADMEAVMRSIMWVDSIHGRLGENVFKSLALADGT